MFSASLQNLVFSSLKVNSLKFNVLIVLSGFNSFILLY